MPSSDKPILKVAAIMAYGVITQPRMRPLAPLATADSPAGSKGRSTQSRRDVGTSDKGQDKAQRHHSERAANEAIQIGRSGAALPLSTRSD